ncbi:DUF389 domain-containing protein [Halobium salinum]|uniref:DUF389 domain-containing protein n=1 Tax=Halobium salinum TaxID=1364940 RepID=A0ABD5P796_9EURY|nr:DUF389 domain-containing protein [Halobium salinum]
MRLLQVLVPGEKRDAVDTELADLGANTVAVEEADGRGIVLYVPVPMEGVDEVLDRLGSAGLGDDDYTVITAVESAAAGAGIDALREEFEEGPHGKSGLSHAEMEARAEDLTPARPTFVALSALSALVAVAGLLIESAIVIVGAMVIAPFAGATLSASVGVVVGDRETAVDSVVSQALGLTVATVAAVGTTLLLRWLGFVPTMLAVSSNSQVGSFITPNLLAVVIALCAGAAGALALVTDLPVSIAGVAVAAALVPSAGALGIGLAFGAPHVAIGALVLLFVNIVAINLTTYGTLAALGYRPSTLDSGGGFSLASLSPFTLRGGATAALVVTFLVVTVLTGFATYQHLAFVRAANDEVENTLEGSQYEELELVGVTASYNGQGLFDEPEAVTVTLGRTTDSDYSDLATTLQRRITDRADQPVVVRVQFVDYEEAGPTEQRSMRTASRTGARPTVVLAGA